MGFLSILGIPLAPDVHLQGFNKIDTTFILINESLNEKKKSPNITTKIRDFGNLSQAMHIFSHLSTGGGVGEFTHRSIWR